MGWLSAIDNTYDKLVLQFVEGTMFLVLPGIWMAVLGWAGMKVGAEVGRGIGDGGGKKAQEAGQKGGDKAQSGASGGKV